MITGVFDRLNPCHVRRLALLIEDKIDALLQPEQEARYRLRAPAEVSRSDYGEFEVILCSPEAYVSAQPKAASFDRFVSNVDMTVHEIGKSAAIRIVETAQAKVRSAFVA